MEQNNTPTNNVTNGTTASNLHHGNSNPIADASSYDNQQPSPHPQEQVVKRKSVMRFPGAEAAIKRQQSISSRRKTLVFQQPIREESNEYTYSLESEALDNYGSKDGGISNQSMGSKTKLLQEELIQDLNQLSTVQQQQQQMPADQTHSTIFEYDGQQQMQQAQDQNQSFQTINTSVLYPDDSNQYIQQQQLQQVEQNQTLILSQQLNATQPSIATSDQSNVYLQTHTDGTQNSQAVENQPQFYPGQNQYYDNSNDTGGNKVEMIQSSVQYSQQVTNVMYQFNDPVQPFNNQPNMQQSLYLSKGVVQDKMMHSPDEIAHVSNGNLPQNQNQNLNAQNFFEQKPSVSPIKGQRLNFNENTGNSRQMFNQPTNQGVPPTVIGGDIQDKNGNSLEEVKQGINNQPNFDNSQNNFSSLRINQQPQMFQQVSQILNDQKKAYEILMAKFQEQEREINMLKQNKNPWQNQFTQQQQMPSFQQQQQQQYSFNANNQFSQQNLDEEEDLDEEESAAQKRFRAQLPVQMRNISGKELSAFMKSKQDIYNMLRTVGQFYLPPYDECNIEYLRDIFAGRKRVLVASEVNMVQVPRLEELSVKNMIEQVRNDKEIMLYLPDLRNKATLNREFLFNIINTIKPKFFPENIKQALRERRHMAAMRDDKYIQISSDMYNMIVNSNMVAKNQRGRALHLLNHGAKKRKLPERQQQQFKLSVDLQQTETVFNARNYNSDVYKRFKENEGERKKQINAINVIPNTMNTTWSQNQTQGTINGNVEDKRE